MTHSAFQILKLTTELPGQVLWHSEPGDNGSLRDAVAVGRYGSEGHADDALMFAQFGDEVGVVSVGAAVEDDEPLVIGAFGFADSAAWVLGHLRTYKEIWRDAPQGSDILLLVGNRSTGKKRPVVSICGNSSEVSQ